MEGGSKNMKSVLMLAICIVADVICVQPSQAQPVSLTGVTALPGLGRVFGINKGNQIAGHTMDDEAQGFIYDKGEIVYIVVPGSENTLIYGIEDNGGIVGTYDDKVGRHGLLYRRGDVTTIDYPGARGTVARALNASMQVVGYYRDPSTGRQRGYLYDKGSFTALDAPGAVNTLPNSISNSGDIAGSYVLSDGTSRGFVYSKNGEFTTVTVPFTGATDTFVTGINNPGTVVGSYIDASGTHAFIRSKKGEYTNLQPLENVTGMGTLLHGINDNGQVVGFSTQALLGSLSPDI